MFVSKTYLSCALGLLLPIFATQASAVNSDTVAFSDTTREAQDLSSVEFLQLLHVTNQAEIKMGSLIIQRAGQDEKLLRYGQAMVRDHSLADDLVKAAAKEKGVSLDTPAFLSNVAILQQDLNNSFDVLESTGDIDFRATLAPMAVQGHQNTLNLVIRAESEISDLRVRALAYLNEPVIREHLRLAEGL